MGPILYLILIRNFQSYFESTIFHTKNVVLVTGSNIDFQNNYKNLCDILRQFTKLTNTMNYKWLVIIYNFCITAVQFLGRILRLKLHNPQAMGQLKCCLEKSLSWCVFFSNYLVKVLFKFWIVCLNRIKFLTIAL